MKYFVIFLILIGFVGFAFAEKEWYVGMGVEKGDFFKYDACAMWDNTKCYPFEMTLRITDEVLDNWNVQIILKEMGRESFDVPMIISKNNAVVTEFDDQWPDRRYVNFYWETIAHLGVYSSAEQPSRLDKSPFGGQVWIGVTPTITKTPEERLFSFGSIQTIPITWYQKETPSTIWVSENISFPVKGKIFLPWNKTGCNI